MLNCSLSFYVTGIGLVGNGQDWLGDSLAVKY